jgi:hypothetical protein
VPVLKPDGSGTDNIAVPEDTDLAYLHGALKDAGYLHNDFPSTQPTKEGAFEYSPSFRAGAKAAIDDTANGAIPNREAGVAFDKNGNPGKVFRHDSSPGDIPTDKITYMSSDFATLHTHPRTSIQGPSSPDIAAAKAAHKTFYVMGRLGYSQFLPKGL